MRIDECDDLEMSDYCSASYAWTRFVSGGVDYQRIFDGEQSLFWNMETVYSKNDKSKNMPVRVVFLHSAMSGFDYGPARLMSELKNRGIFHALYRCVPKSNCESSAVLVAVNIKFSSDFIIEPLKEIKNRNNALMVVVDTGNSGDSDRSLKRLKTTFNCVTGNKRKLYDAIVMTQTLNNDPTTNPHPVSGTSGGNVRG